MRWRLLLVLAMMAIGLPGMSVFAGVLGTANHQLVERAAEQHFPGGHGPGAAHHGAAADIDCSQPGHCWPSELSAAPALAFKVSRGGNWCTPRDVHAMSSMPEASVPPPRRA